jgi:hypothetical protein
MIGNLKTVVLDARACREFCGKRRDKPAWRRRWKSSTSKG